MTTHLEKRQLKRRHLILYLQVIDVDSGNVLGYIVDITTQGIMIMSEFPIKPGLTFNLKMLVDSELSDQNHLFFTGKCVWSHQSVNSDFYDSGFQLLDIDKHALSNIEAIIAELGFVD